MRGGFSQQTLSRTRGRERMSALGGGVHAGGRLVNGARDSVNGALRVADSRAGTDVRFGWGRVHAGGRITLNLTCLRESMIDRGSSPRERAG